MVWRAKAFMCKLMSEGKGKTTYEVKRSFGIGKLSRAYYSSQNVARKGSEK